MADSTKRASLVNALRRRREAIRRAERKADGLVRYLLDRGHIVHGERIADYYQEVRGEELQALEQRERQRAGRNPQ